MFIGSKQKYFIPDVNSDELVEKESWVLAEEFDNTDNTIKVRFLNGDAVQKFAVCETSEELKEAFDKFQEYRKHWWRLYEITHPAEEELREIYVKMYGEFVDADFGQLIRDMHNPEKVLAAQQAAANEEGEQDAGSK